MRLRALGSVFAHRPIRLLASAVAVVVLVVGGATAALANRSGSTFAGKAGGASTAPANLSSSTFEGTDGNLLVDTTGNTDWCNQPIATFTSGICPAGSLAPNLVTKADKPSGSTDDAFGQGTKEDTPVPTVVNGSIPPNKNDLTEFYVAHETVNNKIFLYLAWERAVNIGSATIDFEFNQSSTPTTNGVTPVRTDGDLLITYAFSGSGSPTLSILRWVTTGSTSQCAASNTLPCWGNQTTLGSSVAEGAVNTTPVYDPILGKNLGIGLFGEAAINLSDSNIFPSNTCEHFGLAYTKARSSGSSFGSELKDFIAPAPVNISNCGTIKITKVTQNGDSTFDYTTTGGLSPSTFTLSNGQTKPYPTVVPGSYSVTEGAEPSGWTFVGLTCTPSGSGTSVTTSGTTANITIGVAGEVDCTYTNHTKLSPSISTQLSATSVPIGTAVHDSATLSGATSDASGTVTYTVYTDNACSQNPQSAGTKTVTNGSVPDSDSITFNNAGTFYWQAVYSGDANNNGATSVCTSETLVVPPNTTGMSTAQNLLPNDSATLTGATSNAGGTIILSLFSPTDATCSGTPAYTQTLSVNGNGTYSTTNTTFFVSAVGTWR